MKHLFRLLICLAAVLAMSAGNAADQAPLIVKPLAEKRVSSLPEGVLVWRIENVNSMEEAQAAAGPWTLITEASGKIWLFTLGPSGGMSAHASKVAEVGPIPRVDATEYLLRINDASGPPGSATSIHSHPGSEAFFVLEGQQSIRGTHGTLRVNAGQAEAGHGADQAMQVSSTGTTNLHALVMFVVDAKRPFSSPAALP